MTRRNIEWYEQIIIKLEKEIQTLKELLSKANEVIAKLQSEE